MIWSVGIVSFVAGLAVAGAAARYRIRQIKRDDLSFRMATTIPHSVEDDVRRVGV